MDTTDTPPPTPPLLLSVDSGGLIDRIGFPGITRTTGRVSFADDVSDLSIDALLVCCRSLGAGADWLQLQLRDLVIVDGVSLFSACETMLRTVVEVVFQSEIDSSLSSARVVSIRGDISRMRWRMAAKLGFEEFSGASTDSKTVFTRVLPESLDEEDEDSLRKNGDVPLAVSSSWPRFSSRGIIRNRNREVLVTIV